MADLEGARMANGREDQPEPGAESLQEEHEGLPDLRGEGVVGHVRRWWCSSTRSWSSTG